MRNFFRWLIFLAGAFLILLVLFSNLIGLSQTATWRTVWVWVLSAGTLLVGSSFLGVLYRSAWYPENLRSRLTTALQSAANRSAFSRVLLQGGWVKWALGFAFLSTFIVWYSSLGLFPSFPNVFNRYQDQAEAFLDGQVALLIQPSPALIALPDPYDYQARKGIPSVWDLSYYKGKYYLYWGPVPALILAGMIGIMHQRPPDPILVIFSMIGISAITSTLLWQIRKRAYPKAPAFSIGLFLVVLVMNIATLYNLGYARVYETAILVGQFFLYLGVLGWFYYLQGEKGGWLVLTGLSWGLAIGTRFNLVFSVGVFLGFVLVEIWKKAHTPARLWIRAVLVLAPLGVCGLGLGIFNWARFGSPLETGMQYQFTAHLPQTPYFSPSYLNSNVYLYLFYPYRRDGVFPVVSAIDVIPGEVPDWAAFQTGKQVADNFFGLAAFPALWLLPVLAPLIGGITLTSRAKASALPSSLRGWPQMSWMIALSGLAQFGFLMLFYAAEVRYIFDFSLAFLLTLFFLAWELDRTITRVPILRALFWVVFVYFGLWTAFIGFFGGFDNPPQVFSYFNGEFPRLFAAYWNRFYTFPGPVGWIFRFVLGFFLI